MRTRRRFEGTERTISVQRAPSTAQASTFSVRIDREMIRSNFVNARDKCRADTDRCWRNQDEIAGAAARARVPRATLQAHMSRCCMLIRQSDPLASCAELAELARRRQLSIAELNRCAAAVSACGAGLAQARPGRPHAENGSRIRCAPGRVRCSGDRIDSKLVRVHSVSFQLRCGSGRSAYAEVRIGISGVRVRIPGVRDECACRCFRSQPAESRARGSESDASSSRSSVRESEFDVSSTMSSARVSGFVVTRAEIASTHSQTGNHALHGVAQSSLFLIYARRR